jgi:hypothetical protein
VARWFGCAPKGAEVLGTGLSNVGSEGCCNPADAKHKSFDPWGIPPDFRGIADLQWLEDSWGRNGHYRILKLFRKHDLYASARLPVQWNCSSALQRIAHRRPDFIAPTGRRQIG